MKTELEEAAEKYSENWEEITGLDYENVVPSEVNKLDFINGAKWQQEQEQNNENSWFNEYQEVENYIIKRIGNKFLEATPDKYKTASEATIALLENNWKKERMYSEDDMIMFADFFHNYKELLKKEKWEILEMSKKDIFQKWFEQFKKK